ncbi:hypothetical protein [Streptomyces sp. A5-4]|uniref:hypothetical protein n=1 Tax=Streptomyces sp. A5-4 TaxID=3384771 RepID=UPI003DA9DCF2
MNFRQHSDKADWTDWQLAREAVWLRGMARYSDDPQAEADRRNAEQFTADEVRRIDSYLAAGKPDTGRLAAIEAKLDDATGDTKWLTQQLQRAWAQMDELRDRIDDAGSLMDTGYVASAIRYVSSSREAISG